MLHLDIQHTTNIIMNLVYTSHELLHTANELTAVAKAAANKQLFVAMEAAPVEAGLGMWDTGG